MKAYKKVENKFVYLSSNEAKELSQICKINSHCKFYWFLEGVNKIASIASLTSTNEIKFIHGLSGLTQ